MNAKPLTSQQAQRARDIDALTRLWEAGMPTIPPPPVSQFELWFSIHAGNFGTLAYGLQECVRLYNERCGVMDYDHCIKHSSKVMNCRSKNRAFQKKSLTPRKPSYTEDVRQYERVA